MPETFSIRSFRAGAIGSKMQYALPKRCHVKCNIFTFNGRLVKQVINETKNTGIYTLNMPKLTSGAYYIIFTAGTYRFKDKLFITR